MMFATTTQPHTGVSNDWGKFYKTLWIQRFYFPHISLSINNEIITKKKKDLLFYIIVRCSRVLIGLIRCDGCGQCRDSIYNYLAFLYEQTHTHTHTKLNSLTHRPIRWWWWWMIIVWMFYETTSIDNDRLSGKRENIDKNALNKKKKTAIQSESQLKLASALKFFAMRMKCANTHSNRKKREKENGWCKDIGWNVFLSTLFNCSYFAK